MIRRLLRKPFAAAALVLLAPVGVYTYFGDLQKDRWSDIEFTTVERGAFIIDVVTRGEMKAERFQPVRIPAVEGRPQIVWLAQEGIQVEAGEPVALLESVGLVAQLERREQDLETAYGNYANYLANQNSRRVGAENTVTNALLDVELAELQLQSSGFESDQVREQRRLSYENALLRLDDAQNNLAIMLNRLEREQRRFRDRLEQSEARLHDIRRQIEETILRAPHPGIIVYGELGGRGATARKIRQGDQVHRGMTVVRIPDLESLLIEAYIGEADFRKVEPGQPVDLLLDAMQGRLFRGELTRIAPLADYDPRTRASAFKVTVKLDSIDPAMRPGMTAGVRIYTEQMEEVLRIPRQAIFTVDGRTVVFPRATLPEPQVVMVGERNQEYAVILDGLEPGEQVALTDPRSTRKKPAGSSPLPGS